MKVPTCFWILSLVLLACISYYGRTDGTLTCVPILYDAVKTAATASRVASKDDLLEVGKFVGDTNLRVVKKESAEYEGKDIVSYAASNASLIIIAFRGTKGLRQLYGEYKGYTKPMENVTFSGHEVRLLNYFKNAYDVLDMNKLIPAGIQPNMKYIVTGHSLGGALASIFAMNHADMFEGNKENFLITFGAPRIGDPAWATAHDALISPHKKLLVVEKNDPIPNVPFHDKGYVHHSTKVVISGNRLKVCKPGDNPDGCVTHLNPLHVMDHKIKYYEKILDGISTWVDSNDNEKTSFGDIQCLTT